MKFYNFIYKVILCFLLQLIIYKLYSSVNFYFPLFPNVCMLTNTSCDILKYCMSYRCVFGVWRSCAL